MTPDELLHDLADVFEEKNDDYGDSWRLTGEILHLAAGGETVELETPEDFIRFGLWTRRLDKVVRAFHGEFVVDGEPNFEAIRDTLEDEAVYAAMHAITHAVGGDDDGE